MEIRPVTSSLRPDPFVGRESEMAELTAALDGTVNGSGGLVMLVGEAGIGKTRLTEELEVVANDRTMRVARGAGYDAGFQSFG